MKIKKRTINPDEIIADCETPLQAMLASQKHGALVDCIDAIMKKFPLAGEELADIWAAKDLEVSA